MADVFLLGMNLNAFCLIFGSFDGNIDNEKNMSPGLTGNILIGEWQITLLVHFRRVMECSCKSTLKICRLEFYLTSFTNSKLFLPLLLKENC